MSDNEDTYKPKTPIDDLDKYKYRREGIDLLVKWLYIRAEHVGEKNINSIPQFSADIDHSSLLDRMCQGDKVFDVPPPRAYSYPNYELLEKECCQPGEVFQPNTTTDYGFDPLYIDQSVWKVEKVLGESDWLVKYEIGNASLMGGERRWSDTTWRVFKAGSRTGPMKDAPGSMKYIWRLEKYD